jgi:hypothetical protein
LKTVFEFLTYEFNLPINTKDDVTFVNYNAKNEDLPGYISIKRYDKFHIQLSIQLYEKFDLERHEKAFIKDLNNTLHRLKFLGYHIDVIGEKVLFNDVIFWSYQISHTDEKSQEILSKKI